MTQYKVGLLIPCTSRGRDEWNDIKDTYLYRLSLSTFLRSQDREHTYVVYIGYDADDRIFADKSNQDAISRFSLAFHNISFQFIKYENIKRGHLTKMWNVLYKVAYDDLCDYFYQCGDDIVFKTNGWINDSIQALVSHNNVGIAGPINNNNLILTQALFSRKHMDIFGWMFPEEIMNWCCDDWYNNVYRPAFFYPLSQHFCSNDGGIPRYDINGNPNFGFNGMANTVSLRRSTAELAKRHILILSKYLQTPRLHFVQPAFSLSSNLQGKNKTNFEMVISRYDEDISWSDNYIDYRTVYNKGEENPNYNYIKLDNKGHLADTILRHIITNYDNLANVTFFTHGSLNYRNDQIIKENGPCHRNWNDFISTDINTLVYIPRTDLPLANETFYQYINTAGEIYQRLFNREYNPNFEWACGKWISVSRQHLRNCPKELYQTMLDFVLENYEGHAPTQNIYRTRGIFIERFIIHAIVSSI